MVVSRPGERASGRLISLVRRPRLLLQSLVSSVLNLRVAKSADTNLCHSDCSTRRAIAQEEAAELAQRRRDEGLETEPESELDEVEVGEVEGEAKGNEMEVS